MPVSTNTLTSATVDLATAAMILGVTRKTAYNAAKPGGTIPTLMAGARKLVPKGWLCDKLHLSLDELNSIIANLDTNPEA
jgi:hypothetical protein